MYALWGADCDRFASVSMLYIVVQIFIYKYHIIASYCRKLQNNILLHFLQNPKIGGVTHNNLIYQLFPVLCRLTSMIVHGKPSLWALRCSAECRARHFETLRELRGSFVSHHLYSGRRINLGLSVPTLYISCHKSCLLVRAEILNNLLLHYQEINHEWNIPRRQAFDCP